MSILETARTRGLGRESNMGDAERWASVIGGSVLAIYGLTRRDRGGMLMALMGGGLAARGISGHSRLYDGFEVRRFDGAQDRDHIGVQGPAIRVERAVTINRVVPELFRFWLGGQLAHAREIALLLAPTVNSYKRYQAGTFAPTGIAWSYDNRTAGFRVVGRGPSLRVECRIPGADANPYLAYARLIAAGLDGIARRIDPGPAFQGDVYRAAELPRIPRTLPEAIAAFEESRFVRDAFGEDVVGHLLHFARTEQATFEQVVTDFERRRYFERI